MIEAPRAHARNPESPARTRSQCRTCAGPGHRFVEWPKQLFCMNAIDFPSPIERPRLSDTIYGQLLEEIMAGRFSAGDRLPTENQLAQRFSVSRPVVREALQRLQTDGVVIARQGSGTYVQRSPSQRVAELTSEHSLHEVLQVMELRMALEELAAKLAARNRTEEQMRVIEQARQALGEVFGQGDAAKK